jgi:hypothetical protein
LFTVVPPPSPTLFLRCWGGVEILAKFTTKDMVTTNVKLFFSLFSPTFFYSQRSSFKFFQL